MKRRLILMLVLGMGLFFSCCIAAEISEAGIKPQTIKTVVAPKSPAAIPILRMIESNALGDKEKINLKLYNDMGKMMALAASENYSYLAVPIHTATTLYNKGLDIKLLNVILWGGMYLSSTDPNCYKWEDLNGKQLYVPNKGAVPDIMTQYFFKQHGLKIGDNVELVYSTHTEIAQLIKSGRAKYAIDVEPFVTINKENIENYQVISDFASDWKKREGHEYSMPNFGVVVNNDFLDKNKGQIKTFNEELEKAIKWSLNNPVEVGALAEKYLNANSKLIEKAIQNFHFAYKASFDAKKDIEKYCSVLSSFKPESIGGKIPDEKFYYKNE